jgi:uncharacterized protein YciI
VTDAPPELESRTLVLLKRPRDAPASSDEELQRIQAQHLGHLRAMREHGALVAAGPFSDQPDETLRGLCLYRTDLEETRRLAQSDPSVRAGRLEVEVLTWWFATGSVRFSAE